MALEKSQKLVPIICKMFYQFAHNVATMDQGTDQYSTTITFSEGDWQPVYFSPGTAKFSEPHKLTAAGPEYKQKLNFRYPGENSPIQGDLDLLERLPVIFRFDYNDGVSKIIGTREVPAEFSSDYDSNSDGAGSSFNINCLANHRALSLEL